MISTTVRPTSGVPQGSNLGSLLFTMFKSDLGGICSMESILDRNFLKNSIDALSL